MLFQFLSRHICRIVVVEMMIYAGDVLYSCPPLKAAIWRSFNSVSCICSRQSSTCWCCAWVYLEKRLLVLLSPESTTS